MSKRIFLVMSAVVCMLFSGMGLYADDETVLFDYDGNPAAYIAADSTVYLWNGRPVAYIFNENGKDNIYSFNGRHLGWLAQGIIWNHNTNAVGFKKGAVIRPTKFESAKMAKQAAPAKMARQIYSGMMPFFMNPVPENKWEKVSLENFLSGF